MRRAAKNRLHRLRFDNPRLCPDVGRLEGARPFLDSVPGFLDPTSTPAESYREMSVGASQILVWVEPPRACIRVVGRAAVEGARQFRTLIQRLESQGIHQFCVDLGECRIMDSTFSGVLAALASEPEACSSGSPGERFTLINPNARVRDLLDNLGVLPLVRVIEGTTLRMPGGGVEEISPSSSSKSETTRCCLEAHQFLMDLKPENRQRFAEVTRLLEEQLKG